VESSVANALACVAKVWGVAAFLGSACGPAISGPLLYVFGTPSDDAEVDEDQDYTIRGYTVVLALSSVYFLISAISLTWVKNPRV
jgi:hypothetical protein